MRPVLTIWQRLFRQNHPNPQNRRQRRARLELEVLENRTLLTATPSGTISGVAFVDVNNNGVREASEAKLPGIPVTLSGSTTTGTPVNASTTTDGDGAYNFLFVLPGTYQITAGPGKSLLSSNGAEGTKVISGLVLSADQTLAQDLAFRGLAPEAISCRLFLTTSTPADLPFDSAGSGKAQVADSSPFVKTAITNVSVVKNAANTVIDLAGNFDDTDLTNSQIALNTNFGTMNVELFDRAAPRTVANFFNYIDSGRYDNSIFHRLAINPDNSRFVLQGGGFKLQENPSTITTIPTDATVQNEFGASNTIGTLAMAKVGNDPNSATDQFFINLNNNSANLDNQNGGFTVFGRLVGAADQAVLNALVDSPATVTVKNESASNGAFDNIPMINYNGNNFPTDTTSANYDIVKSVTIVRQNEELTYSVTANTNPGLVTATINNNRLTLNYTPNQSGTATITVLATDKFGATVQTSFNVTVT